MSVHAARGGTRPKSLESALLCALLLGGLLAPRVAVQLHHHPGGDHGHVHLSSSAAHDRHDAHASASARSHHRETYEPSARGDRDHPDGHTHEVPARRHAAHDEQHFTQREPTDHVHTYDPYQRSLKPHPVRVPSRLMTTPLARAVAPDVSLGSAIAPCARGPPSVRI